MMCVETVEGLSCFEKSAVSLHGKLHWEKERAKRRCGGTGSMPGDHSPSRRKKRSY